MQNKTYQTTVGDAPLVVEISSLAEQANAAALVRHGETVVLATAVMSKNNKPGDYFPLRVDYEERFYAAGKILGSRFVRRESRPSEDAILAGRVIDRVIRPLFDYRMRREVQVVTTVLSYDETHDPELPGLIGASLVLAASDIPWNGPAAGISAAFVDGKIEFGFSRKALEGKNVRGEAFVAGPKGHVSMIEAAVNEISEDEALALFQEAQGEIDRLIEFQESIVKEIGNPKAKVELAGDDEALRAAVKEFLDGKIESAVYPHLHKTEDSHDLDKVERERRLLALLDGLMEHLEEKFKDADPKPELHTAEILFEEAVDAVVHENIIKKGLRPDGRAMDEVRPLEGRVALFERTHGSALFVRGNTQALAITTLAAPGQEQLIETMEATSKRRFMLHYNFPPYSVGEVGGFRGPGRREIGHGALAQKALIPLLPSKEDFPYTIRVVSEILSSNGSSSMASVCAATMSLMDAGVPLKKPAAGIAMGLMSDDAGDYKVLTDLQGPEDHYGDMDFKVAGTEDGITAIQLDVKVRGLTQAIIKDTLRDARAARLKILGLVKSVIPAPRAQLSKYAPIILRYAIDPAKIGMVIGPGGKVINGLIEKYKLVSIDIEEDGNVFVAGNDVASATAALEEVKLITRELKVGDIVEGPIIKILDFGAIVDLGGGNDGMIHVSELREGFVKQVRDVVKEGDFVRAKVIRAEEGKIGLSLKQL